MRRAPLSDHPLWRLRNISETASTAFICHGKLYLKCFCQGNISQLWWSTTTIYPVSAQCLCLMFSHPSAPPPSPTQPSTASSFIIKLSCTPVSFPLHHLPNTRLDGWVDGWRRWGFGGDGRQEVEKLHEWRSDGYGGNSFLFAGFKKAETRMIDFLQKELKYKVKV